MKKSTKSSAKGKTPASRKKKTDNGLWSLFIVIGFVFFISLFIAAVLVLQRTENNVPEEKTEQILTPSQAKQQALEAPRPNKPHPINLGDIAVNDTVIDDGSGNHSDNLPSRRDEPEKADRRRSDIPSPAPQQLSRPDPAPGLSSSPVIIPEPAEKTKPANGSGAEVAALPPQDYDTGDIQSAAPRSKTSWIRPERPRVAVVLDDVGVNRRGAELAIELPASITLSFMTYAPGVKAMAAEARHRGHELMLHVPMEPVGRADPGPNALLTGLSDQEILSRLDWGMSQFDGYIGINNHMGSKFTAWDKGMTLVLAQIAKTDYFFLDSRTSSDSVVEASAAKTGVSLLSRDVFIDNNYRDTDKILAQLVQAERIARQHGHAIAIGHPHETTVKVLHEWIKAAEERGIDVVPISKIMALKKPVN
ncbi:divergent polysaccharide deacetylase family protein [Kiloniella laminariae]|uniref:Divergent polysaccharide deacetylase family protein n=1 Tax=Kiloniella laminariae TaxID=454162 RepID=A0ABT4LLS5_9PROT|nr:divergent polysaccharide deacetylase family protein [Kiloniella laminariae]MCZ4282049.1 divergent polysaccharide deacetylase family protein [Kiloniella laminariae]